MKRAVVCLALLALSCESAAKHPAITIGTVTGTMGFGLCALSVPETGTCAIVGGTAALALGGITALVTLLANTNAPAEPDPYLDEDARYRGVTPPPPGLPHGGTPPPPGLPADAGVDAPPVPVDAM